ncbi:hypothetical protein D3C74_360350 [compost metagenome]
MPMMNTTGNSRPFALCIVISTTASSFGFSASPLSFMLSISAISARSVRKETSDLSSLLFSNSIVTDRNSSIFSSRERDSSVFSFCSSSRYWVISNSFSVSSVTERNSTILCSPLIMSKNSTNAFRVRPANPRSSTNSNTR